MKVGLRVTNFGVRTSISLWYLWSGEVISGMFHLFHLWWRVANKFKTWIFLSETRQPFAFRSLGFKLEQLGFLTFRPLLVVHHFEPTKRLWCLYWMLLKGWSKKQNDCITKNWRSKRQEMDEIRLNGFTFFFLVARPESCSPWSHQNGGYDWLCDQN